MDKDERGTSRSVLAPASIRFGPFELDLRTAELRKNHLKIRLQDQPFQILVALLERPGELVLREEIRLKLWPGDTVVGFEHGINAAVNRLRDALCDSAENPRYIETLARKGYRFIGEVEAPATETEERSSPQIQAASTPNSDSPAVVRPFIQPKPKSAWMVVAGILALVAVLAGGVALSRRHSIHKSAPQLRRITFDSGLTTDPAVSPDGKFVSYATDRNGSGTLHVWLQQFMADGQAVQLTHGDADDHQPAFSADGSKVAFRSERDGGGIYVIPTIGGEATLLAKHGRDPRFSPDGRWLAYWQAAGMVSPWVAGSGTVFLIPAAGGPAQRMSANLMDAGVPEWSDDGKRLIVFGCLHNPPPSGNCDWWVVPVDGGPVTSTGAFSLLREKGFSLWPDVPRATCWHADRLLFVARLGDTTNVWSVHLSGSSPRVTGDPERLTSGTSVDAYPSLTPDGRLLFASLTSSTGVWLLPRHPAGAVTTGLLRATETTVPHLFASLSADGKLLAYSSMQDGRLHAWIKNLENGAESSAGTGNANQGMVQLSSDGSLLVYTTSHEKSAAGFIVSLRAGTTEQFCSNCGSAYDFSPDNRMVLYLQRPAIHAFDRVTHRDRLFMESARYMLYQHKFSPVGGWITFEAVSAGRSQIFVAALRDSGLPAPENEWIPVTSGEDWADKPRWSPDGNIIYFVSDGDGFFCLWAQQLDAASKQPLGARVPIAHFHGSRLSIANVGASGPMEISVARDKIAMNLGELTGNVWATDILN